MSGVLVITRSDEFLQPTWQQCCKARVSGNACRGRAYFLTHGLPVLHHTAEVA